MTLQRKAIRRAIASGLRGRTYAGARVHEGAPTKFRTDVDGPCALYVYSLSDVSTEAGRVDTGRTYSRDLEIAVDLWIEEQEDGQRREDLLDDLTGQVEILMGGILPNVPHLTTSTGADAEQVGANPSKSGWVRVEIGFDNRGHALLASARVVFLVVYETSDRPELVADIVPLEGANVTWDFPPPDWTAEALDEIETEGG